MAEDTIAGRPAGSSGDGRQRAPTTSDPDGPGPFGWWTPSAARSHVERPSSEPSQEAQPPGRDLLSTVVLPYLGSSVAKRTRPLRAWMLALPTDLAALLAPLAWSQQF